MKINHSAVKSALYELVKTVEFDLQPDDEWSVRIEILQNTENRELFRCRVWELELHRLTPSLPRDEDGKPIYLVDVPILIERSVWLSQIDYPPEGIIAPDADAALETVVGDLIRILEV